MPDHLSTTCVTQDASEKSAPFVIPCQHGSGAGTLHGRHRDGRVSAEGRTSEFSVEDRNLRSVAYESTAGSRRAAWRIIAGVEQKEKFKDMEQQTSHAKEYVAKVEYEIQKIHVWRKLAGNTNLALVCWKDDLVNMMSRTWLLRSRRSERRGCHRVSSEVILAIKGPVENMHKELCEHVRCFHVASKTSPGSSSPEISSVTINSGAESVTQLKGMYFK